MILRIFNAKLAHNSRVIVFQHRVDTLLAIHTTLRIFLPLTKAFWDLYATFPTTFFRLLANALGRALCRVLFSDALILKATIFVESLLHFFLSVKRKLYYKSA